MESVGIRLRRAREARRLSLGDVAAATKISATALEALERDDYGRVPGGIYGRSFVRSYAELVELDAIDIVQGFESAVAQHQREVANRRAQPKVTAGDREFAAQQARAMKWLRLGVAITALAAVLAIAWLVWRFLGPGLGV